eukprot:2933416-Amphidinium_carterae.1
MITEYTARLKIATADPLQLLPFGADQLPDKAALAAVQHAMGGPRNESASKEGHEASGVATEA